MAESPSTTRLALLERKTEELDKDVKEIIQNGQLLTTKLTSEHKENSNKLDSHSGKLDSLEWKIDSILDQTTRTNGRVTRTEEDLDGVKSWKDKMMGAWFALTTLAVVAAWIVGKYWSK